VISSTLRASVISQAKLIQYLISFMLVNPESTTRRKRRRKQKPLQIIFPKPVRRLRANPEYIDRARTRSKALVGNLTGKHVAGSLGGAVATIAVPNAMRLKGWSDVMASGAVSIGGGIAVKQMDEAAGDAFMLTGLGVTGLKAVKQLMKTAKGGTARCSRTMPSSLQVYGTLIPGIYSLRTLNP
jgi:hypothetical protein